jgi:GNAT superfamily N-acetyltransferase
VAHFRVGLAHFGGNPYILRMLTWSALMHGLAQAVRQQRVPCGAPPPGRRQHRPPATVPIRTLAPRHRERVASHLLALPAADRYLRFGYGASDVQIRRYVDGLDFHRDTVLGIFNRKLQLIALAHLAYSREPKTDGCAEFGVSVLPSARGRGFGRRLFARAMLLARVRGISLLFVHALSRNTAMLRIARGAGATVEYGGTEADAYLRLPPAKLDTRVSAMVSRHVAEMDYRFKVRSRQVRAWLAHLQGHGGPGR